MPELLSISGFLALLFCGISVCLSAKPFLSQATPEALGIFDSQSDVGSVAPPGTLVYDPAKKTYTITSAGANMWYAVDAFHFVWKKLSGDVSLAADLDFPVTTGNHNPHRKAFLMTRQSLDADGIYAAAVQHSSPMSALFYRRTRGETTQDIELNIPAPKRLRLEKRGDTVSMFISMSGEPLHQTGTTIKLGFSGPFYIGLGVCSHNAAQAETAVFSNVALTTLTEAAPAKLALYSTLQTVAVRVDFRQGFMIHTQLGRLSAPNWSKDGNSLIFTGEGKIWKIPATGGTPEILDTGAAINCSGSHGLSPDGKWLAISCGMPGKPETRVYIVPSSGGTPRLLTEGPSSWWHSWSPDGKTILFTRPNGKGGNIYAIPAEGGEERALTSGTGISDDPDYSADGKYIYFNSDRGGSMQIWRMLADGSQPEQITFDDLPNWTPHPSPDGKSMVFLSYEKGVTGHPADKDVALRLMSLDDRKVRVIVKVVGGSGSSNVPFWSPDSRRFAFVSYQMLPAEDGGSKQ